jgi:hypothetical protein
MRQLETQTGAEKGSTMASTRTRMTLRKTFFLVFSIGALVASFAFAGGASAMRETASATPSIVSDQVDYLPGETVTLTGGNWGADEAVHILVNDNVGQSWQYATDTTADGSGSFSIQFQLPNSFVAIYDVTATGATSGTATTSFTDTSVTIVGSTTANVNDVNGYSLSFGGSGQACNAPYTYAWTASNAQIQGQSNNATVSVKFNAAG